VTILSKSPVAQINHPGDGEMRPASDPVPFTGVGRDLEDGPLTGGALVWTSSLDGQIGTGESFNATLTAGTHTVTLTVTDSGGNTDTDSRTLIMTP
jgi:chitinase